MDRQRLPRRGEQRPHVDLCNAAGQAKVSSGPPAASSVLVVSARDRLPAYRLAFAWAYDGGLQSIHLLDLGTSRRSRLTRPRRGYDDEPA
jgi:hypothetical protein